MIKLIEQRTTKLRNHANPQGRYVLYWMQASQRTTYNLALDFALSQAQQFKIPLVVYFSIITNYPSANERHYSFMLHNLAHIKYKLEQKGIKFIIELSEPIKRIVQLSKAAKLLVLDRGYLAHQKEWYENLYTESYCPIIQVEDNVLIPVEVVSQKEEYTASTLRGNILGMFVILLAWRRLKNMNGIPNNFGKKGRFFKKILSLRMVLILQI